MCIAYGRLTYNTSVPYKRRKKKKTMSTKEKTSGNKSLVSVQLCALPSPFFFLRADCCLSSFLRCTFYPSIYLLPFLSPSFAFFKTPFTKHRAFACTSLSRQSSGFFFFFFFFKSVVFEFQWETEKGIRKQSKQFFVFSIALQVVHLNTTHIVLSCFNSWFAKREFSTVSVSVSVFSFFFFCAEQRR